MKAFLGVRKSVFFLNFYCKSNGQVAVKRLEIKDFKL